MEKIITTTSIQKSRSLE